jgi:hypothetical protein
MARAKPRVASSKDKIDKFNKIGIIMAINQLSFPFHADFNSVRARAGQQVYYQIRKQVIQQYAAQLQQATGWKRHVLKWKIALLADIRFQRILFSADWGRSVGTKATS